MSLKKIQTIVLLLCSALSAAGAEPRNSSAEDLFTEYDWQEFRKLQQAQAELDFEQIDTNLLAAAVFHETNRRRQQHELATLQHHAGARSAAAIQTGIMLQRGSISHQNPDRPSVKTLQDRLAHVGLKPRFAAENVATAFGLRYESGAPFRTKQRNGEKIIVDTTGEPIPPHSYVSFAEQLLDQWMQSPGHRKNILHPAPKFLGTSCRMKHDETGMPVFYCTQVFFTPLRSSTRHASPNLKAVRLSQ